MFKNRLFNLIIAAVLIAIVALGIQQVFATKAIVPETGGVYTESNEQALREFQLGERYGEFPPMLRGLALNRFTGNISWVSDTAKRQKDMPSSRLCANIGLASAMGKHLRSYSRHQPRISNH